jgi:hypothetical protein
MTQRLATMIDRLGGTIATPPRTDPKLGYQFEVGGELVEILGPEGLSTDPRTLGAYETIQVDGGTQALRRTEKVLVSIAGGPEVTIRRPTLLGAILVKARAIKRVRKRVEDHREDLVRLLGFVHDPRELVRLERLSASERRWLRRVESDLSFADPALSHQFTKAQIERARQAFAILTR